MLHTKSQGHWSFGSREGDFKRVFTLYGHGGHLGHVTIIVCYKFYSSQVMSVHMKFEFD